jgi:hypothetical protein
VDELTRQRDSITSHLNQLRQLIGGMQPTMPAVEEISAPAQKPALASPEPKAAPAAKQAAPAGAPAAAKAKPAKEEDEDWWQE